MKENHAKKQLRKRTEKRLVRNPHVHKRLMKLLHDLIDRRSADRASYLNAFYAGWLETAQNLDTFAEMSLVHETFRFDPEDNLFERFFYPYTTFALIYFAKLMDRLAPDEETRFREAADKYDHAAQKFFTMLSAKHADLNDTLQKARGAQSVLQSEVTDLFLGEIPPEFTPRWARALRDLENRLKAIVKEVSA